MDYPKAPTAAAASRMILSWSISARTSGRRVALLRGWRSFWTAASNNNNNHPPHPEKKIYKISIDANVSSVHFSFASHLHNNGGDVISYFQQLISSRVKGRYRSEKEKENNVQMMLLLMLLLLLLSDAAQMRHYLSHWCSCCQLFPVYLTTTAVTSQSTMHN